MVHDAPGRSHHYLGSPLELADLFPVTGTSIDGDDAKLGQVLGVTLDGLGHLQGQFPGRCQAKNLGSLYRFVDA